MNQTIPKKPPHKQSNTIDEKHTEMLNQFYENETEIITSAKSLSPEELNLHKENLAMIREGLDFLAKSN